MTNIKKEKEHKHHHHHKKHSDNTTCKWKDKDVCSELMKGVCHDYEHSPKKLKDNKELRKLHPAELVICKNFKAGCTRTCKYQHPNPNYVQHLSFWNTNKGRDALSESKRKSNNCNYLIKEMHSTSCKFGMECTKQNCKFQHVVDSKLNF